MDGKNMLSQPNCICLLPVSTVSLQMHRKSLQWRFDITNKHPKKGVSVKEKASNSHKMSNVELIWPYYLIHCLTFKTAMITHEEVFTVSPNIACPVWNNQGNGISHRVRWSYSTRICQFLRDLEGFIRTCIHPYCFSKMFKYMVNKPIRSFQIKAS